MNKLIKFAAAAGLPAVLWAGAAQSASAASLAITTTPPGSPGAPVGWQTLVDDTGLLTVSAPAEWTDVNTTPAANEDGSARPIIEASPNLEQFYASFDTPGVTFLAIPATTDLAGVLATFDVGGTCTGETTEPFDNGVLVGTIHHRTGCGAQAEFVDVAANSALNPAVTLLLQVGIVTPTDAPVLQTVLQSAGFASAVPVTPTVPTVPGTVVTVPVVPPVPTVPGTVATLPAVPTVPVVPPVPTVPGTTVAGPVPTVPGVVPTVPGLPGTTVAGPLVVAPDAVPVTDDTNHIGVSLPADWTDLLSSPQTVNGVLQPTLVASTDIAVFLPEGPDTFGAPGVIYSALPYTADPSTVLANADMSGSCVVDGAPEPYSDGVFTGLLQRYSACGGTQTRIVTVAASPADATFTAYLLIQITDTDDSDLNTILGSFVYNPAAFAAAAPAAGAVPTTTLLGA